MKYSRWESTSFYVATKFHGPIVRGEVKKVGNNVKNAAKKIFGYAFLTNSHLHASIDRSVRRSTDLINLTRNLLVCSSTNENKSVTGSAEQHVILSSLLDLIRQWREHSNGCFFF